MTLPQDWLDQYRRVIAVQLSSDRLRGLGRLPTREELLEHHRAKAAVYAEAHEQGLLPAEHLAEARAELALLETDGPQQSN
ncbi:hypothetical protein ABZW02_20210 [Streptomyces sp. NPDC005180]|uniref:hypothetical protein n=1 Tax=Streptomyces sp. NPDC005180 TaxID=3156868 RepID=UPI0033B1A1AC